MARDRGNQRLQNMRADLQRGARVAAISKGMREMDRRYAINLAAIRKAAALTQTDLAARLGISQGSVSKIEGQQDWLLSTLADYMRAVGVANTRLAVTVNGEDMEFTLI
ncbi:MULTISPECIES: helix-turn-helix domain-containing protein [Mycobacterium]|nr:MULTISPECIES: helix-turn-helix transcriptional regulator [Mycobacterium]MDP7732656.1 helix-turn-helix transcriptional regulator [Mycobacterium sp. TY813]TDK88355.1 XRE family transcriptional regulator [Mycobacterium paragordonae]